MPTGCSAARWAQPGDTTEEANRVVRGLVARRGSGHGDCGLLHSLGGCALTTKPAILIKRTYDPAARGDGRRILVERLWPRGMKKEALAADAWLKDVAPSTALRQWFGHREERWDEFRRRYVEELDGNPAAW